MKLGIIADPKYQSERRVMRKDTLYTLSFLVLEDNGYSDLRIANHLCHSKIITDEIREAATESPVPHLMEYLKIECVRDLLTGVLPDYDEFMIKDSDLDQMGQEMVKQWEKMRKRLMPFEVVRNVA